MLVKIIIVFLLAMVLVGMVGKVLFPGALDRAVSRRRGLATCKSCGRPRIGKSDCDCKRKG